jgi:hypothetical protein
MKELLNLGIFSSYIKNSSSLINDTNTLFIPTGAKLFTADASSMYTNIDSTSGIQAFQTLFTTYNHLIPQTFPTNLFITTLKVVMENNIFMFGDTFWLQNSGTAMGTPTAPLYATITYGIHENINILPRFAANIYYYKQYLDDIFCIWLPSSNTTWNDFKLALNGFSKLTWNIEELSTQTTFLDLNITIINNTLKFNTYQKPLNLYLYIPPFSSHPQSCFKGFIFGEILRYWLQNDDTTFISILSKFIKCLIARGYTIPNLSPIIAQAAAMIDNKHTRDISNNNTTNASNNALFFHHEFHPNGIHNRTIQKIYKNTLQGHDHFDKLIIATSRPKNLRDLLCTTKLTPDDYNTVSAALSSLKNKNAQANL